MSEKIKMFNQIRDWAKEKGIYENGDLKTQTLKLVEEVGELSKAILNDDDAEIIDAIGDCTVVLTNVAELFNKKVKNHCKNCLCDNLNECKYNWLEEPVTIEGCLSVAYNQIKNRKGKMDNGTFIKNRELNLPDKIVTVADVYSFIAELNHCNLMFHFDDSAHDIISNEQDFELPLFDFKTASKIDSLVEQCYDVCAVNDLDLLELCSNSLELNSKYKKSRK